MNGFLNEMLQAAILYNFTYSGNHLNLQNGIFSGFTNLTAVAWITLFGYMSLVALYSHKLKNNMVAPVFILLMLSWPIEIIFSSLSGRGYEHYYINWLPSTALISGSIFYYLSFLDNKRIIPFMDRHYQIFLVLIVLCSVFLFKNDFAPYRNMLTDLYKNGKLVEKIDPVSEYVIRNTDPKDSVLAWGGELGINFISHRKTMDAYFEYPLFVKMPYTTKIANQFYMDLVQNSPVLVVDNHPDAPGDVPPLDPKARASLKSGSFSTLPDNLPEIYNFIEGNYHLETKIGDYEIYRRNF